MNTRTDREVASRIDQPRCHPRALCGWSPPSRLADTTLKHRVDRLLVGSPALGVLLVVIALLSLAPHVPMRASLGVDGLAALVAGGWCSLNFWRCRHAHCLVTGAGWLVLALFAIVETGIGRSVIHGGEQIIFLAVLAAGLLFEGGWYLTQRTNAVSGWRR